MPLYEYECFLCGHHFERIRRVADASSVRCPKCEGNVRRLLSAPALQFKGSGWYVTDYGKGNGGRSTALTTTEKTDTTPSKKDTPAKPEKKSTDTS
ncbi:MAG: zinc ribbon domain-containing protein [Acidobacteriota bacterium]|jgi:putative FmdB family regulatory protein|nr:zinc ribbon domain-containing protein [Acidobacteriota bacterium]